MQLSTDLPYGSKAVRENINSGASLIMNVSPEADAAFMSELKRTDSERYNRLAKNMQVGAIRHAARGGRPPKYQTEAERIRAQETQNAERQRQFRQKVAA